MKQEPWPARAENPRPSGRGEVKGQIPKYGKDFRLEYLPYSPGLASRAYVLKRDPAWFIRSDKASGVWRVYHGPRNCRDLATPAGTPLPTLGMAMSRLLEGIGRGFYTTAGTTTENPSGESE